MSTGRTYLSICDGWKTAWGDFPGAEAPAFHAAGWETVQVPHNWDDYHGYHQVSHGNLHGVAWYRRAFTVPKEQAGKRCFLLFEGVGSYAKVWLNGQYLGGHAGGRTCFTLDATALLQDGENIIAVRADHPAMIDDLPWVCGGCWGTPNTEGSQPVGIFRPVHLVFTGDVRVEPFGVFVTTPQLSKESAVAHIQTELKNYGGQSKTVRCRTELIGPDGQPVDTLEAECTLAPGACAVLEQDSRVIPNPALWSIASPQLYFARTTVLEGDAVSDSTETRFGMRWIRWSSADVFEKNGVIVSHGRVVDQEKRDLAPSAVNQNFSTYTAGSAKSKVAVASGGVEVTIPVFTGEEAVVSIRTQVVNNDSVPHEIVLESFVQTFNRTKSIATLITPPRTLAPGESVVFEQQTEAIRFPDAWSEENPYLHNLVSTVRAASGIALDYCKTQTPFGIYACQGLANKCDCFRDEAIAAKRYEAVQPGPWTVEIPNAGEYQLIFCAGEGAKMGTLRLDGGQEIALSFRGGKGRSYASHTALLPAGRHTVGLAGAKADCLQLLPGIAAVDVEDLATGTGKNQFLLNGEPVFINGTCEYEHLLGGDHAFSQEQIRTRMQQIKAAGFNALREAHHPHNLRYVEWCDKMGILYWPQMGAHISFDNDRFRENFRTLVKEWVKERRNSPSVILWGIQNESTLPTEFARELTELIRSLDPTATLQRKTTTCNGGTGADWNIPQNWTGTYGGSVTTYDQDIIKGKMYGEYGQYRVIGFHEEGDCEQKQNTGGDVCEELFTYCLETKVRLAQKVKENAYGHFQWIFAAHANPGRETLYCLDGHGVDGVGVINSKGLLTNWGEPVDAYYMYRANFAPKGKEPMVYIASHTWPDRWQQPGEKDNIFVYSNCDEVELFNDVGERSLGVCKREPGETHFAWNGVNVQYNVLYAEGRVGGKTVARDLVLLHNLEPAPHLSSWYRSRENNTQPAPGAQYLYRVNCGGQAYTDCNGNVWAADQPLKGNQWGWSSWAEAYPEVNPLLGSVRAVSDPIDNTQDEALMQSYRYGRQKLRYYFPLAEGDYQVELYMAEPWFGVGGGLDCTGWRLFDVAFNGQTVLADVDLWKEAGVHAAVKKTVPFHVTGGGLEISFPTVKSYQAVISAIAISKK